MNITHVRGVNGQVRPSVRKVMTLKITYTYCIIFIVIIFVLFKKKKKKKRTKKKKTRKKKDKKKEKKKKKINEKKKNRKKRNSKKKKKKKKKSKKEKFDCNYFALFFFGDCFSEAVNLWVCCSVGVLDALLLITGVSRLTLVVKLR